MAAPVSESVATQLSDAASEGPAALLNALDAAISANPALVGTPDSAASLADAAARPVLTFRGNNLPVYRSIVARIADAAPPAVRAAVAEAATRAVSAVVALEPPPSLPSARVSEGAEEGAPATTGATGALGDSQQPPQVRRQRTLGYDVGSFVLYPELLVAGYWDDNIFATPTNERIDRVAVFAPTLYLNSDWDKHALNFEVGTDVVRYEDFSSENSIDYDLSGEGRYDIDDDTEVFGGLAYGRDHEDRDSPDDVNGLEPTIYRNTTAYLGAYHAFAGISVRGGIDVDRLDFDDTPAAAVVFNNDDRDRTRYSVGGRLSYALTDVIQPFVQGTVDIRTYDTAVDDFGFDRDSTGVRVMSGMTARITGKLSAEAAVGYMRRDYDDILLEDFSEMAFSGSVYWRPIPSTVLSGWTDRTIEETTLIGSPGYVLSSYGAEVEYQIIRNLFATLRASYAESDFESSTRTDRETSLGGGIRYLINSNYFVGADYRYQKRDSENSAADYVRNQIFIRFGVQY